MPRSRRRKRGRHSPCRQSPRWVRQASSPTGAGLERLMSLPRHEAERSRQPASIACHACLCAIAAAMTPRQAQDEGPELCAHLAPARSILFCAPTVSDGPGRPFRPGAPSLATGLSDSSRGRDLTSDAICRAWISRPTELQGSSPGLSSSGTLRRFVPLVWRNTMADRVRRGSWRTVLPLGRTA